MNLFWKENKKGKNSHFLSLARGNARSTPDLAPPLAISHHTSSPSRLALQNISHSRFAIPKHNQ